MRHQDLNEGYHVFVGLANVDEGYDAACVMLEKQINNARKYFEIEYLGGIQLKDEGPREIGYAAAQAVVILRKKGK